MLRRARGLAGALTTVAGALLAVAPNPGHTQAAAQLGPEPGSIMGAPFSGVGNAQAITNFPDGNRIIETSTVRYYRDGQGRTRMEREISGVRHLSPGNLSAARKFMFVNIDDPVSGEHYMLHPDQKLADVIKPLSRTARSAPVSAPAQAPPPTAHFTMGGGMVAFATGLPGTGEDSKTTDLGEKLIEGIRAVGTRLEHTIAAGEIGNERPITLTVEQWYSPDLAAVLTVSQQQSTGVDSIYRLQILDRAEPDPALFTVPSDYTRREVGPTVTAFSTVSTAEGATRAIPMRPSIEPAPPIKAIQAPPPDVVIAPNTDK